MFEISSDALATYGARLALSAEYADSPLADRSTAREKVIDLAAARRRLRPPAPEAPKVIDHV